MGPRTVSSFPVWFSSGGAALKDVSYPPRAQTKTGPPEELRTLEKKFAKQNHCTQPPTPNGPKGGSFIALSSHVGAEITHRQSLGLTCPAEVARLVLKKLGLCYQYMEIPKILYKN